MSNHALAPSAAFFPAAHQLAREDVAFRNSVSYHFGLCVTNIIQL